ncbi:hypothetical protein DFJ77DRAFT_451709 [Powellomyces hirtus]|nr:hypothetical protein DFJ77DRAFT_451709 [Powellomyces hirtus]
MMAGGPPPPPPPPGVASTPAPEAEPVDAQSAFLAELRDPNRRRKLRKVAAPPSKAPVAEKVATPADAEAEKNDLYIEMLGYMQAPGGNIEELGDKCKSLTNTARGFIFTLIRRGWLAGVRLLDNLETHPAKPCQLWPGREWTNAIGIPDAREADLVKLHPGHKIVSRVHMYRFDDQAKKHTLDQLALVPGPRFPTPTSAFTEPEPASDNSMKARQAWERWHHLKTLHEQSDFPQYELITTKLCSTDTALGAAYQQLTDTIRDIRAMSEALRGVFGDCSVWELRRVVESIPLRIKEVKKRLEMDSGIIIRDEAVKLTPEFLARGWAEKKNESSSSSNNSNGHSNAAAAAEPTPPPAPSKPHKTTRFEPVSQDAEDEEDDELVPLESKVDALLRKPTTLKVDGIPANFLLGLLKENRPAKKPGPSPLGRVVRRAPTI